VAFAKIQGAIVYFMKAVGLFGGSFDPIHFGHLFLAIFLLEKYQLEKILFCPAACSPFKGNSLPVASGEHRLNMLKLALDHPQMEIIEIELHRPAPSYTIDTVRALDLPNLRLLLSDEAEKTFKGWKEAEELQKLAPLLVGPRAWGISSTEIRQRLHHQLYCGHLVPAKALDYIQAFHLYSLPAVR